MTTGQRIQQARKKAGLSQKQLGERLGLSASMIGQWENDLRKPKQETILKIAGALGIAPFELSPSDISTELTIRMGNDDENKITRVFTPETDSQPEQDAIDPLLALIWYTEELTDEQYERALSCIKALGGHPPTNADGQIMMALGLLNDAGQQKAVERVEELTEIPRYRRQDTPQSTPPVSGGTDTTPPADVPERPQEDE